MMTGKYWLMPPDKCVDVSDTEHSTWAKNYLLNLEPGNALRSEILPFKRLTDKQTKLFRNRGIDKDILELLHTWGDIRIWMIQYYGWIRVRGCYFYTTGLNAHKQRKLITLPQYWKTQTKLEPGETVHLFELNTCNSRDILCEDLRAGRF